VGVRTSGNTTVAGRVESVVAILSGYDSTGAVVLAAHYDTTFGTPGAADDKAAVAGMLETAHALTSGKPLRNLGRPAPCQKSCPKIPVFWHPACRRPPLVVSTHEHPDEGTERARTGVSGNTTLGRGRRLFKGTISVSSLIVVAGLAAVGSRRPCVFLVEPTTRGSSSIPL
jgi:hypothetical protein